MTLALAVASVALALSAGPARVTRAGFAARPVAMGGMIQKETPREGGARVSLLVSGPKALIDTLPDACRGAAGATGVVYGLSESKVEIIAEGDKSALEPLAASVQASADADADSSCRQVWQLPVGGYAASFPLVSLAPTMTATVRMKGDMGTIDYVKRHLQTEAVFNRGLELKKESPSAEQLVVTCKGDSRRLKSFVRWCYAGPPLARADEVDVTWA